MEIFIEWLIAHLTIIAFAFLAIALVICTDIFFKDEKEKI